MCTRERPARESTCAFHASCKLHSMNAGGHTSWQTCVTRFTTHRHWWTLVESHVYGCVRAHFEIMLFLSDMRRDAHMSNISSRYKRCRWCNVAIYHFVVNIECATLEDMLVGTPLMLANYVQSCTSLAG